MGKHEHRTTELTRNQALVMSSLSNAHKPMSAYSILDELREDGLRAPLQVYRALEKLVEFGLVHRLESLNAFVACRHTSCDGERSNMVLFAICETCGSVQELVDRKLVQAVKSVSDQISFTLQESVIELRGKCAACTSA